MTYPRTRRPYPCCEHCPTVASMGWPGHSKECGQCQKDKLLASLPTPPRPATVGTNNDPEEDNVTQFINRIDIKPGDTIRVTREFNVTDVRTDRPGGPTALDHDSKGIGTVYLNDQAQIELVKRPLNLPTKLGSFIEVRVPSFPSNNKGQVGHWLLTVNNGVPRWVSATRSHKGPEEFEEFLSRKGVEFEVIR